MRCKPLIIVLGIIILAANLSAQAQEKTYTIQSAGIRFVIPSDWSVSNTKDNDVIASTQHGAILMTFTPTVNPEQVVAGMIQGLQNRFSDLQIDPPEMATKAYDINGIPAKRKQGGSGRIHGVRCSWTIWILDAKQQVVFFSFRARDIMDKVDRSSDFGINKFWDSIKRVE
jgi:hypothetical protein